MRLNPFETFIEGLRKGSLISVRYMLPAVIAAFVVIEILHTSGILPFLGKTFAPLMQFFGLPGEALAVLLAAWASSAGAIGIAAAMATRGILSQQDIAILLPAILLMGSQLQFFGRILAVAGVQNRRIPGLMLIGLLNAALAMLFTRWILFQ